MEEALLRRLGDLRPVLASALPVAVPFRRREERVGCLPQVRLNLGVLTETPWLGDRVPYLLAHLETNGES